MTKYDLALIDNLRIELNKLHDEKDALKAALIQSQKDANAARCNAVDRLEAERDTLRARVAELETLVNDANDYMEHGAECTIRFAILQKCDCGLAHWCERARTALTENGAKDE